MATDTPAKGSCQDVLERWKQKDIPNLIPIPYNQGYAEYAAIVRSEILRRASSDFIIAVDLPHGLEDTVINAVKNLPIPSLILDPLLRGIPVIPSSAPIEAVRSYLEYGSDIRFIDASLPITGGINEYQMFIHTCRFFGIRNVLKNPENYGIRTEDIFTSWKDQKEHAKTRIWYPLTPEISLNPDANVFDPSELSPYFQARLQYMAGKIKDLLQSGLDILLVCDIRNLSGILHYITLESQKIDDTFVFPTRTIYLEEHELIFVTGEVPFFSYLYDLFRDHPVKRSDWINQLLRDSSIGNTSAFELEQINEFARRLAFTNGSLLPSLYDLMYVADLITDPEYILRLYLNAVRYPPAYLKEDRYSDYYYTPKNRSLLLDGKEIQIIDYHFAQVTGSAMVLRFLTDPESKRRGGKTERRLKERRKASAYNRWSRTRVSLQAEQKFIQYILSRFSPVKTDTHSWPQELTSGLLDGIDIRETLRNSHLNTIFVKNPEGISNFCYIFDFRDKTRDGNEEQKNKACLRNHDGYTLDFGQKYRYHFFLDKYYSWVGLGVQEKMHIESYFLVLFLDPEISSCKIFQQLDHTRPLASGIEMGLSYAGGIILFTDNMDEIDVSFRKNPSIRRYSLCLIPEHIQNLMRGIDIERYRTGNKRGD